MTQLQMQASPVMIVDSPRIPHVVKLFFAFNVLVIVAAVVTRALGSHIPVQVTDFFRLSYESNFPTAYSGFQHIVVALLYGLLAIREIRIDVRRWAIALPALMFLFFALDELAMIHERLSDFIAAHVHSLKAAGEHTSTPALIFCVPAVLLFAGFIAHQTRRYWQGRPRVAWLFVIGLGIFLFSAAGLETIGNLLRNHHALFSLEALLEEAGEMTGVTVVLWSAIELLSAESLQVAFEAGAVRLK